MANTYSQIYIQAVFAVKYRQAILDKSWRSKVFGVMGNLINETGCKTLIVNGVEDHVHCFFSLRPAVSISHVMKNAKAKSSKFINDHSLTPVRFEWQVGYAAFSYGHNQMNAIFEYVANQEEHHKAQNFRSEYLDILKANKVNFDEQYIFDELK